MAAIMKFLTPPENIRDNHAMEPHDAGWRKYVLVLFGIALLTYGFIWTGDVNVPKEILERRSISFVTYGEFMLGILGLYFGANVGYKIGAGITNSKTMTNLANRQPCPDVAPTGGKATEN